MRRLLLIFLCLPCARAAASLLVPALDLSLLRVSTPAGSSALEPVLNAELGVTLYEAHTLGLSAAVTPELTRQSGNAFFYSDVSLFYRYRFVGAPRRAARFPTVPTYGAIRIQPAPPPDSVFGAPFNMDFGGRVFFSVLRGSGAGTLDSGLAHSFQGATLGLWFDRRVWRLRLHGSVEGGYALLQGRFGYGALAGALTWDRFARVAPGIRVRYTFLDGEGVDNKLFGLGAVLYFKM